MKAQTFPPPAAGDADVSSPRGPVARALRMLGVERLVLSIHQLSFPASDDDLGSGTPYSARGRDFLSFAARLGFTGVALGPGGVTSRDNPSPYDGTLFSLDPTLLSPAAIPSSLVDESLLPRIAFTGDARRADHRHAYDASRMLIRAVRAALRVSAEHPRELAEVEALAAHPAVRDEAHYEGHAAAAGTDDWRRWPSGPCADHAAADVFVVGQWLLRRQHAAMRAHATAAGLRLYADAQVGVSHRDAYLRSSLFLRDYVMGAPPSRTNPDGQPWGYPILDPAQVDGDGAGARFLRDRFDWLLGTHDGIRLDHPHGWVCPWAYRSDDADALHAVQHGARLHESPHLPDHPALARFARVRAVQIDDARPRYDDAWVRDLEPAQVNAYGAQIDLMLEQARAHGVSLDDVLVEVLSTCPRPLFEVLAAHGLGRFRVTQKAKVREPADVYRSDNAAPRDWIMMGNHDTPPLRLVVRGWLGTPEAAARAAYLAARLEPQESQRPALAQRLTSDPHAMSEAMLADLFIGPAKRVIVFWADLFGEEAIYNRPGVVHDDNWTLRVPPDFEAALARAQAEGRAPRLGRALALALHARGMAHAGEGAALMAALR